MSDTLDGVLREKEICFAIDKMSFLLFCTQLNKQGCDVLSVNTHYAEPLVWVANCPILKNFLLGPRSDGRFLCSGFEIRVVSKKKGKTCRRVKNMSYFDLMQMCERQRPTSWSPPCCFDCVKKIYF